MNVHQNISINKVYAKKLVYTKTSYAYMPIYVDRSNAGSCIYLFSLFCSKMQSLVFDGTCLYIVFNNLVDAVNELLNTNGKANTRGIYRFGTKTKCKFY